MRHTPTFLVLIAATTLAGCTQHGAAGGPPGVNDNGAAQATTTGHGILSLRPKTDPTVLEKIRKEDQEAQQKAQAEANAQMMQQQQQNGGMLGGRVLPRVSTDPIAPPAEEVASNGPVFSNAQDNASSVMASTGGGSSPAQIAATYGGGGASFGGSSGTVPPPPPGVLTGSPLVPPPSAVTLSTQAAMGAGAVANNPYESSPYANPWLNPYQVPFQGGQQQMMPAPQARPSGSPFGGGGGGARVSDDQDSAPQKKHENFVPITPTGMEARSAYKQSDDLKVLWNGALTTAAAQEFMGDKHFAEEVSRIKVGLPGESTRGAFNINPRVVDNIFKAPPIDRRIVASVKKLEQDVAQAYYGYLFTYNRFALSEQTMAARKQQVDVADSAAEQQRAAADLSQAQSDVDSAKEDMHSAQLLLASTVGASAARSIIGKVSGITPSLETLAQAPEQQEASKGGGGGGINFGMPNPFSLFHHGKKAEGEAQPAADAKDTKVAKADKQNPTKKDDTDKKKEKHKSANKDKAGDLTPAPTASADSSDDAAAPTAIASSSGTQDGGISFELKGVNVQPRKSILTVTIRNSGSNNYSFSPDLFSISEGNRKLPDASVRTDFDQTMVQPNSEVKGTITIFGRPWNDKLAVVLSSGSRTIQLRR